VARRHSKLEGLSKGALEAAAQSARISLRLEQPLDTQQIIMHLEAERDRLDTAITALQRIGRRRVKARNGRRRMMTAETRKRMSLAQKKRWSARKGKAT
jgi:hypothetical protein